ncbi:MAG: aspartate kinase, partial [Chloroflexi bacterium]|nr:aspartate kinase [Chloroflexota bacterium]
MAKRTVLKFGGTSVATQQALESLARIVAGLAGERTVVVSATSGTTDALLGA